MQGRLSPGARVRASPEPSPATRCWVRPPTTVGRRTRCCPTRAARRSGPEPIARRPTSAASRVTLPSATWALSRSPRAPNRFGWAQAGPGHEHHDREDGVGHVNDWDPPPECECLSHLPVGRHARTAMRPPAPHQRAKRANTRLPLRVRTRMKRVCRSCAPIAMGSSDAVASFRGCDQQRDRCVSRTTRSGRRKVWRPATAQPEP